MKLNAVMTLIHPDRLVTGACFIDCTAHAARWGVQMRNPSQADHSQWTLFLLPVHLYVTSCLAPPPLGTTFSLPSPLTLSPFILILPPACTSDGWWGSPSLLALPWKWICSWTFSGLSRFFAWYCTVISKPPSCLSVPVHLAEWLTPCLVL